MGKMQSYYLSAGDAYSNHYVGKGGQPWKVVNVIIVNLYGVLSR